MIVTNLDRYTIHLDNFEGPLQFLLHLIQKSEIDIYDIPLRRITEQYLGTISQDEDEEWVNSGAEFIGATASLMWLKSKMLLPSDERNLTDEDNELDPRFEIIHQLLEYSRFKQLSKVLAEREHQQNGYFLRGSTDPEIKPPLGIENITLDDLAAVFAEALKNAEVHKGVIYEESWRVADKIALLRALLRTNESLIAKDLFDTKCCREELIVTFLAILELMKLGELRVHKDDKHLILTNYG